MPSALPNWRVGFLALAAVLVLYAFVVGGSLLFGVFLVAVCYLVAWLIDRVSGGNPLADMSPLRSVLTGLLVFVVLAYSLVIATELLLGVLVAATVVLVSWVTSPVGPVAQWLDRRR
jgi:hypothetical protein